MSHVFSEYFKQLLLFKLEGSPFCTWTSSISAFVNAQPRNLCLCPTLNPAEEIGGGSCLHVNLELIFHYHLIYFTLVASDQETTGLFQ